MKYVRTARGYEILAVTGDNDEKIVVTSTPQKVSNANAELIEDTGRTYGVSVRVLDSDEVDDPEDPAPVVQPTPDLSAGVSAISGTGDPVTSSDLTTTNKPGNKPGAKGRTVGQNGSE